MKTSFMALLCLIFTLLCPSLLRGQALQRQLDSLTQGKFPDDGPGTVISLSRGNELLYQRTFGKANIELGVNMGTEQVFRLGSLSKQFTAVLILQLVEQGKISLQDDIRNYLPEFPEKKHVVSIEALLTHTAGVINYTGLASFNQEVKRKDLSPKQLIDLFSGQALEFEPGTDYKYSNSGYVLLGYLLEKIYGKTYAQVVQEKIFGPLGMRHSYYDYASSIIPGRASGYVKGNDGYKNADYLSMSLPYAAGGLLSTAGDMRKWYSALHDGKVLKQETLKKAFSAFQLTSGRFTGYGYGWETGNVQGSASAKHVGVVNGFFTYAAYLPEENLSVSILRNCDSPYDPDALASQLLAVALGKPYNHKAIALSKAAQESVQGVFRIRNGGRVSVRLQDGDLMYYALGGPKTRMISFGTDYFVLENTLNTIKFNRNSSGKVCGFDAMGTGMAASAVLEKPLKAQSQIKVALHQLQSYTGRYQFDKGPVFEVVLENNTLFGQVGKDRKELVAFTKHRFYARDLDALIVFHVDAKGKITGLTKTQNTDMEAGRVGEIPR